MNLRGFSRIRTFVYTVPVISLEIVVFFDAAADDESVSEASWPGITVCDARNVL